MLTAFNVNLSISYIISCLSFIFNTSNENKEAIHICIVKVRRRNLQKRHVGSVRANLAETVQVV